ncbi:MAG TPA: hypothetical protein VFF39_05970 [Verrucomicrobiae bacterium]|nr:hypothetical protein [Verrucomicrobiae bacterium]
MLFSCPICGSGTLKPISAAKIIYFVEGNQARALEESQVCSCESNGHLVIIPVEADLMLQISETNSASAAPETIRILNSWKEIAAHLGRGVRTVQRWEQELGLPIRRPRGKSRSAVLALVADLDEWLLRAPIGNGQIRKGDSFILNPTFSTCRIKALDGRKQNGSALRATGKRPERRSIV